MELTLSPYHDPVCRIVENERTTIAPKTQGAGGRGILFFQISSARYQRRVQTGSPFDFSAEDNKLNGRFDGNKSSGYENESKKRGGEKENARRCLSFLCMSTI